MNAARHLWLRRAINGAAAITLLAWAHGCKDSEPGEPPDSGHSGAAGTGGEAGAAGSSGVTAGEASGSEGGAGGGGFAASGGEQAGIGGIGGVAGETAGPGQLDERYRVGMQLKDVSAGSGLTCGIRASDATLVCWGRQFLGLTSPPAGRFRSVSVGYVHACAIREDDEAICWGAESVVDVTPKGVAFEKISAGSQFSCGIRKSDQRVECWGKPECVGLACTPADLPDEPVTDISGSGHVCALVASDDTAHCWYAGVTEPPDPFTAPPELATFTQIAAGRGGMCGVQKGGASECWPGATPFIDQPPQDVEFKSVHVGGNAPGLCGIRASDDEVECWVNPGDETAPPPGIGFSHLTIGDQYACGLMKGDGTVICWGLEDDLLGAATPPTE